MNTLLFCMLLLSAETPAPERLADIYQDSIPCRATPSQSLVPAPADQLNDYFIAQREIWSVLTLNEIETLTDTQIASLQPGLLLPDLPLTHMNNEDLKRLRAAQKRGARPVTPLYQPTKTSQQELMLHWCSLGLCPEAFYFPLGLSEQVGMLLDGTYLTKPTMAGAPNWPLPHRRILFEGRDIIPLLSADQKANGFVAQFGVPSQNFISSNPEFMPISWITAGIEFYADNGNLKTNFAGVSLTQIYKLSLSVWPHLVRGQGQVFARLSIGFAWLSFALMIFNLAFLASRILRYPSKKRNTRSRRQYGSR